MNELNDLKKKRSNLNIKIRGMIQRDKEPSQIKEKVLEYLNITNKLIQKGANVRLPKVQQFNPQYWDTHTTFDFKDIKSKQRTVKEKTTIKEVYIKPQKYYYILNIAWTDNQNNDIYTSYNEKLLPFIEYLNLNILDIDKNKFNNRYEYIIKCNFSGDDESFNIIKKSVQYIIDINKLNVEIYGKKIKSLK